MRTGRAHITIRVRPGPLARGLQLLEVSSPLWVRSCEAVLEGVAIDDVAVAAVDFLHITVERVIRIRPP